jgi:NADPH-dependent 2,4-dienoyl-CoA reductase/sulfur reductase-like enzyme/rhodanese-related sulfurtransferase
LPNVFTLKGIEDAEKIKQLVASGAVNDVVIVGGGLIGVEMAEALEAMRVTVTVVEMLPQILAPLDREMAALVQRHMTSKGVEIRTAIKVEALEGSEKVEAVVAGGERMAADAVIIAVGIRPEVQLAREAGLEIGATGAIRVNKRMRTSDPHIYAAGDCTEMTHLVTGKPVYAPLGSTANKQGRVAAINICGGRERFPGVLGSTIVKVFDFNVGVTGLSEKAAREAGYDVVTCLVPGADRADYYPGKKMLMLKLIAERATGRLLGAQAVGPGEAAKRLDVAATAITAGMTVEQVSKLDLCYAPPYSPALDNIITAANVIRNKIEGRIVGISPIELAWKIEGQENVLLLDVRTPAEFEKGHLKNAVHIPLGALRKRAGELPRDREIVVYCGTSLRAYEGALILRHAGYEHVKVLDGSVAMWPFELER